MINLCAIVFFFFRNHFGYKMEKRLKVEKKRPTRIILLESRDHGG